MNDDCLPLPALTLGQIAELFPQFHPVTIARWRTPGKSNSLPVPDYVPADNDKRALWSVATVVDWAEGRGMKIDSDALTRLTEARSHEM